MNRREFVFGLLAAPLAASLRPRLHGRVFVAGDAEYERLRRVLSAKVDRRPLAIVQCASADDVRYAIDLARRKSLPLAIRGGAHSLPGHSTCDGGVVLDMSGLRRVAITRNIVQVDGGALLGAVDRAAAAHGLAAVLGECPTVGIGGFALGGGEGALMSRYGAGCDNVVAAEIVLADGRLVRASEHSHPDLFWAIRGGGGNFGVATSFTIRAHPVTNVLGGTLAYRPRSVGSFLRFWRDYAATIPDELTMILHVMPSAFLMRVTWCGDRETGERTLLPLRKHEDLVRDRVQWLPYLDLQTQAPQDSTPVFDETRSGFIPELKDAAIDAIAAAIESAPPSFSMILSHFHGAVTRVPIDAMAYPLRSNGFDCWLTAEWERPDEHQRAIDWVVTQWSKIAPFSRGAYVNGLEDEGPQRVREAYGANYARLTALKKRYDPDNVFRMNQNIRQ